MRWFAGIAFFAGLSLLGARSGAQDDMVYGSKGTPTRGRITAVTPDRITLQATGGARDFDVREVVRVTFGGEPRELTAARMMSAEGRFDDALKQLGNVKAADVTEDLIKRDLAYYNAYCQGRRALSTGEEREAAITAMKMFLGANRNSFHFYDGVELLGDLNLAISDFAQAATFYGLLAKAPWPDYRMRAEIQLANAKCADGKYEEALPMYEKLLSSGVTTPETAQQVLHATVGKAVCLATTGKPPEALKILEEIVTKNDSGDSKLFGRVYNAIGLCHMKMGKPKEAILAFLHTEVLYSSDADTAAEAQYYLSKLWDEAHNPDRANRARNTLQSSYGGSRWAGKK